MSKKNMHHTKKGCKEEVEKWYTEDWACNIDKPIGQEWRDSQEKKVTEEVVLVELHLHRKNVLRIWGSEGTLRLDEGCFCEKKLT